MGSVRTSVALLAIGLGVGACGALQGLDKFEECNTDEECGLVGGATVDGPTTSSEASTSPEAGTETSTGTDAGCTDVLTDPKNCGRCGNVCATGFACTAGTCTCSKTTCGGDAGADAGALSCVDTSTDVKNCGGCGNACSFPNAVAKCVTLQCAVASCEPGFVDCDGNPSNGCECAADSCFTAQKLCAKRVFTTSTIYDGNLGGLAGADAKCQARAVAGSLPGNYKAWLSDAAASPSTRFVKSTIPYRLVDGTLVANDFNDLTDGTLTSAVTKTELNGPLPVANFCGPSRTMVWSNTAANGTLAASGSCANWTDNANTSANWGEATVATSSWTSACSGGGGGICGAGFASPLYCFQQ